MKNRIIIAAAFAACLALCAAVWTHAERNDRRDHSTADTPRDRRTGVSSNCRKARIGNSGS